MGSEDDRGHLLGWADEWDAACVTVVRHARVADVAAVMRADLGSVVDLGGDWYAGHSGQIVSFAEHGDSVVALEEDFWRGSEVIGALSAAGRAGSAVWNAGGDLHIRLADRGEVVGADAPGLDRVEDWPPEVRDLMELFEPDAPDQDRGLNEMALAVLARWTGVWVTLDLVEPALAAPHPIED